MRNFVLILSIIISSVSVYSQTENVDNKEVYNILFPNNGNSFKPNDEIELLINVLDKKIFAVIDTLVNYKSLKYTIFQPYNTQVCVCSDEKGFVESTYYLNDKIGGTRFKYSELWKESNGDTLNYLQKVNSHNNIPFFIDDDKYSLPKYSLNLSEYTSEMQLNRFLVYDYEINNRLKSFLKNNRKIRRKYIDYLSKNVDYFNPKKKIIAPQPIGISYLIIGCEKNVYAGLDIYGSHYLLTIDKKNKKITENKRLWIY